MTPLIRPSASREIPRPAKRGEGAAKRRVRGRVIGVTFPLAAGLYIGNDEHYLEGTETWIPHHYTLSNRRWSGRLHPVPEGRLQRGRERALHATGRRKDHARRN